MSLDDNKAIIRTYVETVFNRSRWIAPASWSPRTSSITLPCPARRRGWRASSRSGRCTWPASPICGSRSRSWSQKATKSRCAGPRGHPPGGAAGHPAHRQAGADRRYQYLSAGRGEDRRALGAVGSAGADAAARRRPGPGRARQQQAVRVTAVGLALILATLDASASNRMAVLATPLYLAGVVMVGASGQRIMITLGLSAGSTRTTSIVSPDALMVPLARGVVGSLGKAEAHFPSRARFGAAISLAGPDLSVGATS